MLVGMTESWLVEFVSVVTASEQTEKVTDDGVVATAAVDFPGLTY